MAKVHGILDAGPLPALPFMRACDVCPFTLLHASSHASGRPPGPRVRPFDPKHPLKHPQSCFIVAVSHSGPELQHHYDMSLARQWLS